MKKVLSVLLCLMMLLPVMAQAKTFSYTIPELIERQLDAQSSLRVQLTAAVSGDAPALVDAQTWELLKTMLPALKLNSTYFKSKSQATSGNEQVKAELLKGEDALSTLILTGKENLWLLETDLLPGKVYSLSRDMQTAYLNLSRPETGEWPNILRAFVLVSGAGEEFSAQLDAALADNMAVLNSWLQGFTKVEMSPDAQGNVQMKQVIRVPAEEVKAQIKETLKGIYTDEALLALLRTLLPAADAQAYLESGMLPVFYQAIDEAALAGEIVITRVYNGEGLLENEEILLPFVSGTGLREVTIAQGQESGVSVTLGNGSRYALSIGGENGTYNGEISVTPAEGESFAALYTLSLSLGEEQYIEENTARERDQQIEAVLLLQPKEEGSFHAQSLTASVHLMAGASSTRPAYVEAALIWRDMVSGSQIALNAAANTSAGLRQSEVDAAFSVQADTLPRAEREELLQDIQQQLHTAFTSLITRMMPGAEAL